MPGSQVSSLTTRQMIRPSEQEQPRLEQYRSKQHVTCLFHANSTAYSDDTPTVGIRGVVKANVTHPSISWLL